VGAAEAAHVSATEAPHMASAKSTAEVTECPCRRRGPHQSHRETHGNKSFTEALHDPHSCKIVFTLDNEDSCFALASSAGKIYFIWIADYPDNITAAAVAVAVQESGMVKSHQTLLLTVEDMDAALKKPVDFRAPGA